MFGLWKTTRKNTRKGPSSSATEFPEGTIEYGNDNKRWVVVKSVKNIQRWSPLASATLFGYTPLTAKYLADNIGKPITVYEREMRFMWPKKRGDFDVKYTFTPSGDAEREGKIYKNWLQTRKPAVEDNDLFVIKGTMRGDLDSPLKVAPKPGELVSTNLMNTDAFVKSNA
jgi:hypothetical protein